MANDDLFRQQDDAATPLTAEEKRDLKLSYITFRHELDEAEQENIARAQQWALARSARTDILTETFLLRLHKQMLNDVWKWAEKYRGSERNIGIDWWLIQTETIRLLDDVKAWIEYKSYTPDELAVRFHHRLVAIHPFPNGNGRHARLMADLLIMRLGAERFTWGSVSLSAVSEIRSRYIAALKAADAHDLRLITEFARS